MKATTTLNNVSDMEPEQCVVNCSMTNIEQAKEMYLCFSCTLPRVAFGNMESRDFQQPMSMKRQGAALQAKVLPKAVYFRPFPRSW